MRVRLKREERCAAEESGDAVRLKRWIRREATAKEGGAGLVDEVECDCEEGGEEDGDEED